MKVVVTGAGGFVGRHLMQHLVRKGWEPVAVGRGTIGDIGPATDWSVALAGADAVVHLAAVVHVMRALPPEDEAVFQTVNAVGTQKLARDAAESGIGRLVFLSTSKVMGDASRGCPFTEADTPQPGDAYARSKLRAEELLLQVAEETGIEVTVLRPPLVYGPGVRGNFESLLALCARGWPLPFRLATNRRSLVSVRNLCDAIGRCLEAPRAAGLTAFVRDGVDLSTAELVGALRRSMDVPERLLPVPRWALAGGLRVLGQSKVATRLLDSLTVNDSLFRSAVGWSAPQAPGDALDEVARWFVGK